MGRGCCSAVRSSPPEAWPRRVLTGEPRTGARRARPMCGDGLVVTGGVTGGGAIAEPVPDEPEQREWRPGNRVGRGHETRRSQRIARSSVQTGRRHQRSCPGQSGQRISSCVAESSPRCNECVRLGLLREVPGCEQKLAVATVEANREIQTGCKAATLPAYARRSATQQGGTHLGSARRNRCLLSHRCKSSNCVQCR